LHATSQARLISALHIRVQSGWGSVLFVWLLVIGANTSNKNEAQWQNHTAVQTTNRAVTGGVKRKLLARNTTSWKGVLVLGTSSCMSKATNHSRKQSRHARQQAHKLAHRDSGQALHWKAGNTTGKGRNRTEQATNVGVPRSLGLLGVARANTAVGVSPETFLLLLLLLLLLCERCRPW
jgi:hypothetical protein